MPDLWGWGSKPPDGRTGPIVANRLSWIKPAVIRQKLVRGAHPHL